MKLPFWFVFKDSRFDFRSINVGADGDLLYDDIYIVEQSHPLFFFYNSCFCSFVVAAYSAHWAVSMLVVEALDLLWVSLICHS